MALNGSETFMLTIAGFAHTDIVSIISSSCQEELKLSLNPDNNYHTHIWLKGVDPN